MRLEIDLDEEADELTVIYDDRLALKATVSASGQAVRDNFDQLEDEEEEQKLRVIAKALLL